MAGSFSHRSQSVFSCSVSRNSPAAPLKTPALSFVAKSPFPADSGDRRRPVVVAAARCGGSSSLNAPLEPSSSPGRSLGGILQSSPESFYDAASTELNRLWDDREDAVKRMYLSSGSPEACLHRRIAHLKVEEYVPIVEDIMYMIIYKKFSEIRVPLVPTLDKCLYNGRLEILPSKDCELETIHAPEVLELIREYMSSIIGWNTGSSVKANWAPTNIQRLHLSHVYLSSILFGYFLKSASLRHRLERQFSSSYLNMIPSNNWAFLFASGYYGIKSVALGEFSTPRSTNLGQLQRPQEKPPQKLRCYLQSLDKNTLELYSKMRSDLAMDLVQKHCSALFFIENLKNDSTILTSMASLKRLVLEAVAFGCFLWDAEEFVDGVFKLEK